MTYSARYQIHTDTGTIRDAKRNLTEDQARDIRATAQRMADDNPGSTLTITVSEEN